MQEGRRRVMWAALAAWVLLLPAVGGLLFPGSPVPSASALQGRRFLLLPLDGFPPGSVTAVRLADHGVRCPYGRGFYLVREGDRVLALSWRDSLGEVVVWDQPVDPGRFHAPASGTVYERTGEKIAGPGGRDLDRYPAEVRGGVIRVDTATLILGRGWRGGRAVAAGDEGCWREPALVTGPGVRLTAADRRAIAQVVAGGRHFPRLVEVPAVLAAGAGPAAFFRFREGERCWAGFAILSAPGGGSVDGPLLCADRPGSPPLQVLAGTARWAPHGRQGDWDVMYGFAADRRYPAVELVWRAASVRVPVRPGLFAYSRPHRPAEPVLPDRDVRLLDREGKPAGPPEAPASLGEGVVLPAGVARLLRVALGADVVVTGVVPAAVDEWLVLYRRGPRESGQAVLAWRFGRWEMPAAAAAVVPLPPP